MNEVNSVASCCPLIVQFVRSDSRSGDDVRVDGDLLTGATFDLALA